MEMRALKTILIIVLAVVGLALVLGLFVGPKVTIVERTTSIQAPSELIWPHVSNLRLMHEWSPWKEMDADQEIWWEGEDGSTGSVQSWVGDTIGTGSQRITALEHGTRMESKLIFLEPWESSSVVEVELGSKDKITEVVWRITQENDLVGRIFAVFMDLEKMVGPDLEKGLANLKEQMELEQAAVDKELKSRTFRGFVIERVVRPEIVFIGKRALVKWADMQRHMESTYAIVDSSITTAQVSKSGPASAVYFAWDEKNQKADLMPAFPVKDSEHLKLPNVETYVVPPSSMLKLELQGGYGQMFQAHTALNEMIEAHDLIHYGNVIEEYLVSPATERDSTKWLTHIYYMVR